VRCPFEVSDRCLQGQRGQKPGGLPHGRQLHAVLLHDASVLRGYMTEPPQGHKDHEQCWSSSRGTGSADPSEVGSGLGMSAFGDQHARRDCQGNHIHSSLRNPITPM